MKKENAREMSGIRYYLLNIASACLWDVWCGYRSVEISQDKAHHRKQGAGVVTYIKPLSRSNAILRRLLNEHGIRDAYGTRDVDAGQ